MAEDFPMKSTNSNGWFNATATESTESYRIHIITCYDTISRYLNVSYHFRSWPIYHSLISLFGCNSYGNVSTITMDDSSTIARREKATLITPRCGSIKRPAGSDQGQHEKRTLSVSGAFVLDHMDRMDAIVCIWSVYMRSYVYITLHYTTLHYITWHYILITLHYIYTHTHTYIYIHKLYMSIYYTFSVRLWLRCKRRSTSRSLPRPPHIIKNCCLQRIGLNQMVRVIASSGGPGVSEMGNTPSHPRTPTSIAESTILRNPNISEECNSFVLVWMDGPTVHNRTHM